MTADLKPGDCVEIPGGRIGRVRERNDDQCTVRVRRKTSKSHQFLVFSVSELKPVDCPKGWMSPAGYIRYLKVTLTKMRRRKAQSFKPNDK
jgi:hypothetical protein